MKIARILAVSLAALLAGCHSSHYQSTVDDYVLAAPQVELGMSPAQVRRILEPTQRRLDSTDRRHDARYRLGETLVEIHYYRSGWQPDGRLTDDEYTPYLFQDGALIAIGWTERALLLL